MLTRKIGTLLGTFAFGLLAACSGAADATSSSESAVTNGGDDQQGIDNKRPAEGNVDSIGKICSYGDHKADVTIAGGRVALYSSCGNEKKLGEGIMMDLASGDYFPLDAGNEVHRVRLSPDGRFAYFASMDRKEGAKSLHVHIDSIDGFVSKDIALFDMTLEDSPARLAQRIASFEVKFSPDGKTAVLFGFDTKGDGYKGRLIVASLEGEGQTVLKPSKAISPDADVTFAPDNSRVLILSTMSYKPQADGDARRQQIYDITLGAEPKLTESPEWALTGHTGEVTIVPGSFDGKQLLRFDADPKLPTHAGRLAIAGVDGTVTDLSSPLGVTSHSPEYKSDAEMHDANNLAALRLAKMDETTGYLFPGAAADSTEIGLYMVDAKGAVSAKLGTDAITDGAGFARLYGNSVMYPARAGVGMVDFADAASTKLIATDTNEKIFWGLDLSHDGKIALLQTATDTAIGYETLELATGKVTELQAPAQSNLRVLGNLEGDWAEKACGYDGIASTYLRKDGTVVAFAAFAAEKPADCKRTLAAPELLTFAPTGEATNVGFATFVTKAGAPTFDLSTNDRGVITQCGLEGNLCAAYIEVPAAVASTPAPAPAPEGNGDGNAGSGEDEGKPAVPATPKDKPAKNGGDNDDGVVVTNSPPASNGATSGPSATPIPSVTSTSAGCSAAPNGTGSAGFGIAFLLGLTVLGRRRRRD